MNKIQLWFGEIVIVKILDDIRLIPRHAYARGFIGTGRHLVQIRQGQATRHLIAELGRRSHEVELGCNHRLLEQGPLVRMVGA